MSIEELNSHFYKQALSGGVRVLLACEESQATTIELRKLGFDAWSCDILPTEREGKHLQCDVRDILCEGLDI